MKGTLLKTSLKDSISNKLDIELEKEFNRLGIVNKERKSLIKSYTQIASIVNTWKSEKRGTLTIGINGGQGSGKSTLVDILSIILKEQFNLNVVSFSIDDIYKTWEERTVMGQTIHPLLKTRGVPGTHDVNLGIELIKDLSKLKMGELTYIPVFDKATDNRKPKREWKAVTGKVDVILFEGWCLNVTPQSDYSLIEPCNDLEANEDEGMHWRRYVNTQIKDNYKKLFKKIDKLVMLKVPDMKSVVKWRLLQEQKLIENLDSPVNTMSEAEIERFVMHFERLTQHMLKEIPKIADVVLPIDKNHIILKVEVKS